MSSVKKRARPSKPSTPPTDQTLNLINEVKLTACIAEASPLRYTPAAIPALNIVLEHESDIVEGGTSRKVKLTVRAVAFGPLAQSTGQLKLGKPFLFTGFMINARTSKSIVLHIQSVTVPTPI